MNMEMYWSQQEVFLMGTLALFDDKIKGVSLKAGGEWQRYFGNRSIEELAQQLSEYKTAGYIEFEQKTMKSMLIVPNEATSFGQTLVSVEIKEVYIDKVTDDLTQYLKNWRNDKLLTSAAYKPDDSTYQHDKLLAALAQVYGRQGMPRINAAAIFGDNTNHESPFWETVLAPQLIDKQYEIRQMDYDLNNHEQPFVDIKITDLELDRSLELTAMSSDPISDDDPEELQHRGLRIKRDNSVDYNGVDVQLTGQETAALRALMKRPEELRPREDIAIELSPKNAKPDNLAKLISSLRRKLKVVMGYYNCIESKFGQGWMLKIRSTE